MHHMRPALLIHGGAGPATDSERDAACQRGCARAWDIGWSVLAQGGAAVDAVVAAVVALEDDPLFNAGVGSTLTEDGRVEMDASLMDGRTRAAGAAAVLTRVRNPIRLAQVIMNDGRHVMMAGEGAEAQARARGLDLLEPNAFVTEWQRALWAARRPGAPGTVGAVAVDRNGHVAAATSTGGRMLKQAGRIGDSAVIGAGTYADDRAGAASCTGAGEAIVRCGLARTAVDLVREGRDPRLVATQVIAELTRDFGCEAGIIIVDRFGRVGLAYNTPYMAYAHAGEGGG